MQIKFALLMQFQYARSSDGFGDASNTKQWPWSHNTEGASSAIALPEQETVVLTDCYTGPWYPSLPHELAHHTVKMVGFYHRLRLLCLIILFVVSSWNIKIINLFKKENSQT